MTPQQLELLIERRSADVLRLQRLADKTQNIRERALWRNEARRAAADVASMVRMRAPQTVRAMEQARGLA